MRASIRDVALFAPLLGSLVMAAMGSAFRHTHPGTPNYDFAAVGGALGSVSFLFAVHIVFFERRRPDRYRKGWHRIGVGLILWAGGCATMAWNLSSARP